MSEKVGRNEPCPCGSGKKYKKCCLDQGVADRAAGRRTGGAVPPKYRFESGSYGGGGAFVPSIACLKLIAPDEWDYHFVLVKPEDVQEIEDEATSRAEADLNAAFALMERIGGEKVMADSLKARGYLNLTEFNIVNE